MPFQRIWWHGGPFTVWLNKPLRALCNALCVWLARKRKKFCLVFKPFLKQKHGLVVVGPHKIRKHELKLIYREVVVHLKFETVFL